MTTAALEHKAPANTVPVPDVTALMPRVVHLSELLKLHVTDDETAKLAGEGIETCAQIRAEEKLVELDKACRAANALHKYLTGLRGSVVDPLDTVDRYLRTQLANFQQRRERAAKELEEKLKREQEEKTRAQEEERDPWDEEEHAIPATIPHISVPALPVAGLGLKKKPTTAIIEGFEERGVVSEGFIKLVTHIAIEAAAGDTSLMVYLLPNQTALTQAARQWGKKITEERLPGVIVIDDAKTISRK